MLVKAKYESIDEFFGANEYEYRRLNLGCGAKILPEYCNLDAYVGSDDPHRGGFFIPDCIGTAFNIECGDDFFDEILAQHIFEHFTYNQCRLALQEIFRVLKPGGVLIMKHLMLEG